MKLAPYETVRNSLHEITQITLAGITQITARNYANYAARNCCTESMHGIRCTEYAARNCCTELRKLMHETTENRRCFRTTEKRAKRKTDSESSRRDAYESVIFSFEPLGSDLEPGHGGWGRQIEPRQPRTTACPTVPRRHTYILTPCDPVRLISID